MVNGFRRYFAYNDIRVVIVARNLAVVVVADVSVCRDGREFSAIPDQQHESEVVGVIIIGDEILNLTACVSDRGKRNNFRGITVFDFPICVGLHGRTELFRGEDKNRTVFLQWRGTHGVIVQEMILVDILKCFGNPAWMLDVGSAVETDAHGDTGIDFQLFSDRIVGKWVESDRYAMIVMQLISITQRNSVVVEHLVLPIGGPFLVGDILRVYIPIKGAFGRCQLEISNRLIAGM